MFSLIQRMVVRSILLVWILPAAVFAQSTGSISGVITSYNDQSPISDVNVFIPNTTKGTTTNSNGEFTLTNISAGTYIVRATFI